MTQRQQLAQAFTEWCEATGKTPAASFTPTEADLQPGCGYHMSYDTRGFGTGGHEIAAFTTLGGGITITHFLPKTTPAAIKALKRMTAEAREQNRAA